MDYYDDDEYYQHIIEYDNKDPIELVSEEFSKKAISDVLISAGLIAERIPKYSGNMERLVFVYGDDAEVYSSIEIIYIERIESVFMYPDFSKKLKRGNMMCRVIAARIEDKGNKAIASCVAFEKIINKALDGFNVFLFVTEDSVFFGCRVFDKNDKIDCVLSKPIKEESQFEQIIDELSFVSDNDEFLKYYDYILNVIIYYQDNMPSYEELLIKRKGIKQSYLDGLDEIGNKLGVDFAGEKEHYINGFMEKTEERFSEVLDNVYENLSFIKTNRINTYEMLFEADEMMRQAEQVEAENERMELRTNVDKSLYEKPDKEALELLENPEEMIKLFKKRRGL